MRKGHRHAAWRGRENKMNELVIVNHESTLCGQANDESPLFSLNRPYNIAVVYVHRKHISIITLLRCNLETLRSWQCASQKKVSSNTALFLNQMSSCRKEISKELRSLGSFRHYSRRCMMAAGQYFITIIEKLTITVTCFSTLSFLLV
jgi:hypothetical protein